MTSNAWAEVAASAVPQYPLRAYGAVATLHKADGEVVVAGYASPQVVDREKHLITREALAKDLPRFLEHPHYRNANLLHSNVQVGEVLPSWTHPGTGEQWTTHVDDVGLFAVVKVRTDAARPKIVDKVLRDIEAGKIASFSISADAPFESRRNECVDGACFWIIDEIELYEITLCETPVNQDAKFALVSKAFAGDEYRASAFCQDGSCPLDPTVSKAQERLFPMALIDRASGSKDGKIYLRPGEKAPEGAEVTETPRGARWYWAKGRGPQAEKEKGGEPQAGAGKPKTVSHAAAKVGDYVMHNGQPRKVVGEHVHPEWGPQIILEGPPGKEDNPAWRVQLDRREPAKPRERGPIRDAKRPSPGQREAYERGRAQDAERAPDPFAAFRDDPKPAEKPNEQPKADRKTITGGRRGYGGGEFEIGEGDEIMFDQRIGDPVRARVLKVSDNIKGDPDDDRGPGFVIELLDGPDKGQERWGYSHQASRKLNRAWGDGAGMSGSGRAEPARAAEGVDPTEPKDPRTADTSDVSARAGDSRAGSGGRRVALSAITGPVGLSSGTATLVGKEKDALGHGSDAKGLNDPSDESDDLDMVDWGAMTDHNVRRLASDRNQPWSVRERAADELMSRTGASEIRMADDDEPPRTGMIGPEEVSARSDSGEFKSMDDLAGAMMAAVNRGVRLDLSVPLAEIASQPNPMSAMSWAEQTGWVAWDGDDPISLYKALGGVRTAAADSGYPRLAKAVTDVRDRLAKAKPLFGEEAVMAYEAIMLSAGPFAVDAKLDKASVDKGYDVGWLGNARRTLERAIRELEKTITGPSREKLDQSSTTALDALYDDMKAAADGLGFDAQFGQLETNADPELDIIQRAGAHETLPHVEEADALLEAVDEAPADPAQQAVPPQNAMQGGQPQFVAKAGPSVAGLAVVASDTGRVLMIQRALDDADPAAGTWEFPGGHMNAGEAPEDAARREWCEETGHDLPDGRFTGRWDANGVYRGYVYRIDSEAEVPVAAGRDEHDNPDDPNGDNPEAIAWWDPEHIDGSNPVLRSELAATADDVRSAISSVGKAFQTKALGWRHPGRANDVWDGGDKRGFENKEGYVSTGGDQDTVATGQHPPVEVSGRLEGENEAAQRLLSKDAQQPTNIEDNLPVEDAAGAQVEHRPLGQRPVTDARGATVNLSVGDEDARAYGTLFHRLFRRGFRDRSYDLAVLKSDGSVIRLD